MSPLPGGLKPLKISCTSTDCEIELHCFKAKRRVKDRLLPGPCRDCGAELVDWDRVHRRDINDRDYTFQALRNELIRHYFWHKKIDQRALNHARRKGKRELRIAARARLVTSIGPASEKLFRDGMQTPRSGSILFYAQHATAACCRKCVEYWHDIPSDRDLTSEELDYLTDLVWLYVEERLPDLHEDAQYVPPITRDARQTGAGDELDQN